MSFIESPRFPDDISYGSSGGPTYLTTIQSIKSGYESRNQDWTLSRHKYDVSYGIKRLAQLNALISFFNEARGRAHSFRFKDHLDYQATNETITDVNGTLYLSKTYGTTNPYVRIINKPVPGTVTLSGAGTVNYTTGVVSGASVSDTWSGEFDVPVRFDQDEISASIDNYNSGATSVSLIEVRL